MTSAVTQQISGYSNCAGGRLSEISRVRAHLAVINEHFSE